MPSLPSMSRQQGAPELGRRRSDANNVPPASLMLASHFHSLAPAASSSRALVEKATTLGAGCFRSAKIGVDEVCGGVALLANCKQQEVSVCWEAMLVMRVALCFRLVTINKTRSWQRTVVVLAPNVAGKDQAESG